MSNETKNTNMQSSLEFKQLWTIEQAAEFLCVTTKEMKSYIGSALWEEEDFPDRCIFSKEILINYFLSKEDDYRKLIKEISLIDMQLELDYKNPYDELILQSESAK